jgi:hypothetical protein
MSWWRRREPNLPTGFRIHKLYILRRIRSARKGPNAGLIVRVSYAGRERFAAEWTVGGSRFNCTICWARHIASSRASSDTSPSSRRPRLRRLFLKATVNIDQKTRCATAKRYIRARIRSTISPSGSITGFTGRNTTAPSRRDKTLLATNPRIIQTAA